MEPEITWSKPKDRVLLGISTEDVTCRPVVPPGIPVTDVTNSAVVPPGIPVAAVTHGAVISPGIPVPDVTNEVFIPSDLLEVSRSPNENNEWVVDIEGGEDSQRAAWELGHPDYLGQDRFDNILARLNISLGKPTLVISPKEEVEKSRAKKKKTKLEKNKKEMDAIKKREEEYQQNLENSCIDAGDQGSFARIQKKLDESMKTPF